MLSNYIKNLLLILKVYKYSFIRGGSKAKDNYIRNIIVMPASKLGDLVCATPIFRGIKSYNKDIKVTVCASAIYEKLFVNSGDVDSYFKWDETKLLENIVELRKLNFDAAIITTPSFIASVCFFLAGIKTIVVPWVVGGFCPYQTISYRIIRPLFTIVRHKMGNYAPREYLKLLEPIGIKYEDTTKHLMYSDKDMNSVKNKLGQFVTPRKIKIGIAPGVGNDIKQWDPVNFSKIADYVLDKYDATIYLIGTKNDSESIRIMKENMKNTENVIDTSGLFDLSEIKAFISTLHLLIAVDTGVIYVAEAFNVPTIDIIGSMAENEQPPRGKIHKLVYLKDRKPEIHIMNARSYDKIKARKHIDDIKPDMVFPNINELLNENTNTVR